MRGIGTLIFTEFRLLMREPATVFFALVFPILLLLILGSAFGNEPESMYGGYGQLDVSVQGYLLLVIGTVAFMSLPVTVSAYRERGILRWLRATPLRAPAIIISQIAVNALIAIGGSIVLLLTALWVFDLKLPENASGVIAAWALSYLAFSMFGFILVAVLPNPRAAQAAGSLVYFPQLFLSGSAGIPREEFPEALQTFSNSLPMTQAVELIQWPWTGEGWNVTASVVITIIGIASTAISVWFFRWE